VERRLGFRTAKAAEAAEAAKQSFGRVTGARAMPEVEILNDPRRAWPAGRLDIPAGESNQLSRDARRSSMARTERDGYWTWDVASSRTKPAIADASSSG
jgi:hypothetical protein